jgi:hypothetical protein
VPNALKTIDNQLKCLIINCFSNAFGTSEARHLKQAIYFLKLSAGKEFWKQQSFVIFAARMRC